MPAPVIHVTETILPHDDIPAIIRHIAEREGVDPELMLDIAYAESKFRNVPNYKYDGEKGGYTAFGIFQFTRTTYKGYCGDPDERFMPVKNIECAARILKEKGGTSHWEESRNNGYGGGWENKPYTGKPA